jgi:hypothetical protein
VKTPQIVGTSTDFGKPCWLQPARNAVQAVVGSLASWCHINSLRRTSAIAFTMT